MASANLDFELECSVCFNVPTANAKIFQCGNGHLLCDQCHAKLESCPSCKKRLYVRGAYGDDGDEVYGGEPSYPIRCLLAEKLIRQHTTFNSLALPTVQSQMDEMNSTFKSLEAQMKEYNNTLKPIANEQLRLFRGYQEKDHVIDDYGFTVAFVVCSYDPEDINGRFGLYWGPQRNDINMSGPCTYGGTSIEPAIYAILSADKFGISKLCIIFRNNVPIYPYIERLYEWNKRGWNNEKNELIPYANRLKKLHGCLTRFKHIAVTFRRENENHSRLMKNAVTLMNRR